MPLIQRRKTKRIYLVNRDFQLRYTKIAVAVGLCSTILTVALILMPLFQLNILRFPNFVPYPFIVAMVAASLINFFIIAAMGILITHRIAGPMFSLVRHIRMMQLGKKFVPLKVRDSDDLKYLVRNFNELLEHLSNQSRRDCAAVDDIIAALRRPDGGTDAAKIAEGLRDRIGGRVADAADIEKTETA